MSDLTITESQEEETRNAVIVNRDMQPAASLDIAQVKERVDLIQQLLKEVMIEGEHYGKLPGFKKDILMKSGAEKIGLTFRLVPEYSAERIDHPNYHREYTVICTLRHNGDFAGQGIGSCSSLESKYRYRTEYEKEERAPSAYWNNRDADQWKGRKPKKFDDGWFFVTAGDKIENPDIPDQYNTILKMAKKRAHVDAILTATASSDIFTQDLEDNGNIKPPDTTGTPNSKDQASKPKDDSNPSVKRKQRTHKPNEDKVQFADIMKLISDPSYTGNKVEIRKKAEHIKNDSAALKTLSMEIEKDMVPF